jgi:hypothetical protein
MTRSQNTLRLVTLTVLLVTPVLAHAHGAMSGDELGPPLLTSGLLGFVSYWVVMLWPSSRRNQTPQSGSNGKREQGSQVRRPRKAGRAKRMGLSGGIAPARVVRRPAGEEESSNG